MKKTYLKPTIASHNLQARKMLCLSDPKALGNTLGNDASGSNDPANNLGKDDWEDDEYSW